MPLDDPIELLARQRIISLSAELEVQLGIKDGGGPTLEILRRLRGRAAESLAALATIDAEDFKAIRTLQNEVKRYDEWVAWIREIIQEGKQLDAEMETDDREEIIDLLVGSGKPEAYQTAIAMGLIDDQRSPEAQMD
jgi:hypothetical protein